MDTTLSQETLQPLHDRLARANAAHAASYPGDRPARQPVHTLYGGAHLFGPDTPAKLGSLARRSLADYAPDAKILSEVFELEPEIAEAIYDPLRRKLETEPVEDYRIDFEDGYGHRPDSEEDRHAVEAARAVAAGLAAGTMPPFLGVRIKPLGDEVRHRSLRTLDLFMTTLAGATGDRLPARLVVTLPKITSRDQVAVLSEVLDVLETRLGWPADAIRVELMVETPPTILDASGRATLPDLVRTAGSRCLGAHFGPYDYTATLDITASHQRLDHPACDFARAVMQVSLAGTGLWLADGPTTVMPIGPHRPSAGHSLSLAQLAENSAVVHQAWQRHYEHVRRGLAAGFYQGWDLHPAQLPVRYTAVYAFFREGLQPAADRLQAFMARSAQATRVGDVFDDAATGQGLLNYFLRAVACGAVSEAEARELGGLSMRELETRSFLKILQIREGA